MPQKKSRVIKYAELRKKIESTPYEDDEEDSANYTNYKSDEERHQNTNPKSPQVLHNTLSIPLEDLLNEDGKYKHRRAMMTTLEFKTIDTPKEQNKKKKKGTQVSGSPKEITNLFKKWWMWVIIGLLGLGIIIVVIYFSLNY